ncbi:heme-binding protein [Pseudomonadota bacterium]
MNYSKTVYLAVSLTASILSSPWVHADDSLVTFKSMSPATALELAQATLASCSAQGYQVSVAVVDRMGIAQVMLRDRYAGPHTPDTARRKAWTAVSFRSDTLSLAKNTGSDSAQSGARHISGALLLGGGVPVMASGSIVGGVGVSGAPSGQADHSCAQKGVSAMVAKLELAD